MFRVLTCVVFCQALGDVHRLMRTHAYYIRLNDPYTSPVLRMFRDLTCVLACFGKRWELFGGLTHVGSGTARLLGRLAPLLYCRSSRWLRTSRQSSSITFTALQAMGSPRWSMRETPAQSHARAQACAIAQAQTQTQTQTQAQARRRHTLLRRPGLGDSKAWPEAWVRAKDPI